MKKKNKQLKTLYLAKETIVCLSGSGPTLVVVDTVIGDQESTLPACVDTSINT